ncbi:uncharacterized protein LOC123894300 isoform X1 [Trifolium pratense]|uniref:uncharacterized protein LOC123894300 isoform X1 n=1 Tax=Trifolium pratense TaxID=57577 RepID=UPI001E695161|nr:uncharacterized protein LOC123894300 isoform X1 [Trifolium pratense]
MASSFDRWEKDPFFNAAEEVQESADRVEYIYRTWIHAIKDDSSPWNPDELLRDLHTALDTAKWQLEEFQRAVRSSYSKRSGDDARNRHQDFIVAIDGKISKVGHLLQLQESVPLGSKVSMPWVSLDEGERNELASFLSGMPLPPDGGKPSLKCIDRGSENQQLSDIDSFREAVEEKQQGHRRVASANVDTGSWKIAVSDNMQQSTSSNDSSGPVHKAPMHKVASLSGFFSSVESISKFKWPKNGYKKLKAMNHHQETDNPLLPSTEFNEAINACTDECYGKPLHGWYGAFLRQVQRSQYKMQYNRPVQVTVWIVIILCFIVLIAFCTM